MPARAPTLVRSSVGFTLGANVEKLALLGGASIGIGNGLANAIAGNAGADRLKGKGGKDTISGGDGRDKLWGNAGHDVFVFDSDPGRANRDKLKDFRIDRDTILLDESVFASIGGKLGKHEFVVGKHATDSNDYVIYHNGRLYYDPDGRGGAHQQIFAKLAGHPDLDHKDFTVGDFVI